MTEPKVYSDSWDVDTRLAKLGLKPDKLIHAVQRGLAAWASCTKNHPPASQGVWAWAETVCGLRDELVPLGWSRSDEANLPLTVNADKTLAICVNTGNEDTGIQDGSPCTRSTKGPQTRQAIRENLGQLRLFGDEPLPATDVMFGDEPLPATDVIRKGRTVWILLIHRDMRAREVRAELSQPISISDEGKVDRWKERIVLSSTPFDDDLVSLIEGDNGLQTPEIDIEIKKRA